MSGSGLSQPPPLASATRPAPRYIDIGANLSDSMYRGRYNGKFAHAPDLQNVISRARRAGVVGQIVTGGSLKESRQALKICQEEGQADADLFCTVGCHPTRSSEFDTFSGGPDAYLNALSRLVEQNSVLAHGKRKGVVVAIGECGLDYDRLRFCSVEVQKKYFAIQLSLAIKYRLPLFLHSRAAAEDFYAILSVRMQELATAMSHNASPPPSLPAGIEDWPGSPPPGAPLRVGVVHSFTGSMEEMRELVSLGLFIGVNGCSLKTEENLAVVKAIPLSRLMLETDAPWCDLRPTHASAKYVKAVSEGPEGQRFRDLYVPPSAKKEKHEPDKMVKGRNEPCTIGQVAAVVAAVKGVDVQVVAEIVERNTIWLFGL